MYLLFCTYTVVQYLGHSVLNIEMLRYDFDTFTSYVKSFHSLDNYVPSFFLS